MASFQDPRDTAREQAASRDVKTKTPERKAETDKPAPKPTPVITDWAAI